MIAGRYGTTAGILICHWNGRFGNRMHQYAYVAQYARTFGLVAILPSDWEGTRLFATQPHRVLEDDELRLHLNQSQPALDNLGARARAIERFNTRTGSHYSYLNPDNPNETWAGKRGVFIDSVCAYNQSIFGGISRTFLKDELFVFNDDVRRTEAFKRQSDKQGTYDVAHLRRDDMARPADSRGRARRCVIVSKQSYLAAFREYALDPGRVEWVSDDYLRKWHREREEGLRGGWTYPTGSEYMGATLIFDWLPDFLKLYFARTIVRANSSFSWWAAFLSPTANVYSPVVATHISLGGEVPQEVDCKFVEGNHPHWLSGEGDIYLKDEGRREGR